MDVMRHDLTKATRRDKQILCGYFLSRFDQDALNCLGFASFTEAFNALGYALEARPASIKNYRDEFDPLFPNSRKGWHGRPLREHIKRALETYSEYNMVEIGAMIGQLLFLDDKMADMPEVRRVLRAIEDGDSSAFAKRLITGKAAERYFTSNYPTMSPFENKKLTDTTQWGCGFDFKLSSPDNKDYWAVEVKGLRAKTGQIQMTELEYKMAGNLSGRYFLVVVRNFEESPFHTLHSDPVNCGLDFTLTRRNEIRHVWTASLGGA